MGDKLADAVGRRGAGAAESADLRQTCRGGHFNYRKLAEPRVCGGGLFAQRVRDRDPNALRTHGLNEAVNGALAAVGHGDTDDLAGREMPRYHLLRDGAYLSARDGSLERVGHNYAFFHFTPLPCL